MWNWEKVNIWNMLPIIFPNPGVWLLLHKHANHGEEFPLLPSTCDSAHLGCRLAMFWESKLLTSRFVSSMYSVKLLLYDWFLCFHVIITTIFLWYLSYLLQGKHRAGPVIETYKTREKCSSFCWCVSIWFSVGFLGVDLSPDKLLMERYLLCNGKSLLQRKHSVHASKTFTDDWVKLQVPFSCTETFWGCAGLQVVPMGSLWCLGLTAAPVQAVLPLQQGHCSSLELMLGSSSWLWRSSLICLPGFLICYRKIGIVYGCCCWSPV